MGKKNLNSIIAIIILITCGAFVFAIASFKRTPSRNIKLLEFPLKIGEWTGNNIKFKDKEYEKQIYEILGTDKVLLRSYTNEKNEKVAVQIVYSDQNRQSFHPPEYCYLGSGYNELLETGKVKIALDGGKTLTVNKAVYQARGGKILLLDWYMAGDLMTENYYKQQIYFVMNQIKHGKSGGSAVRIWTSIIGNDADTALDVCRRLIYEAVKILPDYI